MKSCKESLALIFDFIEKNNDLTPDTKARYTKTYTELKELLSAEGMMDSSPPVGKTWIEKAASKKSMPPEETSKLKNCLICLKHVCSAGTISEKDFMGSRTSLSLYYWSVLDDYLNAVSARYTKRTLASVKWAVGYFLLFMQNKHKPITDIDYEIIDDFYPKCKEEKPDTITFIIGYLDYLAEKGIADSTYPDYLHYHRLSKAMDEYPADIQELFYRFKSEGKSDKLYAVTQKVIEQLSGGEYGSAVIITSQRLCKLVNIFFSRYHVYFTKETALAWIENNKDTFAGAWSMAKCAMDRLVAMSNDRTTIIRKQKLQTCPEWAAKVCDEFIQQKVKEKLGDKTVSMYSYCITRFLNYVDKAGIHAYADLSSKLIRKFNIDDVHETVEGKNACNSRVRRFLQFLEREGYVSDSHLDQALMAGSTSYQKNIVVLSSAEIKAIEEFCKNATSARAIRDRAVILLGLKMGMRGCDIATLKLSDINWKRKSVRFIQRKTGREIELPMPVSVGNALFSYIRDVRPRNTELPFVFLSLDAPCRPVKAYVGYNALKDILPDRKVWRSGFHVTRKTFATGNLNAGVTPEEDADLLGHSDMSNVHKYISLDSKRMRLCAFSPSEFGIGNTRKETA